MTTTTTIPLIEGFPPVPAALDFTVLITPADDAWRNADARQRRAYFEQLGKIALQVKIAELLAGLDKDGRPLAPVSIRSRRDRASGPPLCPHGRESRTIRLLDFEPTPDGRGVRLFWPRDWAKVLGYHADGIVSSDGEIEPIRDVFGISPAGLKTIEREALDWWQARAK